MVEEKVRSNHPAWKEIERCCPCCQKFYKPSYKPQVCCSRICAVTIIGINKTKKMTKEVCCTWCKKQFVRGVSILGKTGNFCSVQCGEAFKRGNFEMYEDRICKNCSTSFNTLYRKEKAFCSKSCSKSGKFHPYFGKVGPAKGHKPWTYGLTTETDDRLKKLGEKSSITNKNLFATGVRSHYGKKNPNFGKTVADRTPEQMERYSKAASKRLSNGYGKIKGRIFSSKNNIEIHYRSSYEFRFMKCLEADTEVISWQYEKLSIKYGDGKRYVPDFLVFYKDNTKSLIEIKCDYTEVVNNFKNKKLAAEAWCINNDCNFKVKKLLEIEKYEQQLKDLCL